MRRKTIRSNRGTSLGARRQRGMSTLLIVSVVALAVTGTTLATVYALKGSQQRQLTTHAMTTAQAAAWRGVEVLRNALEQLNTAELEALQTGAVTGAWLSDVGVKQARIAAKDPLGTSGYRITAIVTGQAGQGSALTTSTVEVIYELAPAGSGSTPVSNPVCASLPSAPMVFNGDLNITGGSLSVTNTVNNYENIAVAGDINLSSASAARISGCAKGNINLSGGGITENGHLFSQGNISISSMTPPNGTTLWGRQITLDGSSSGARYAALKAGGYAVSLVVDKQVVGASVIGGTLIPSTVSGGIPWTQGTVLPLTSTSPVEVTLQDGSKFLLDLGAVTVDLATGQISGAASASDRLSGEASMPDNFSFRSNSIHGGDVTAQGLARTELVWGHTVTLGVTQWGVTGPINVGRLWANGDLKAGTGNIDSVLGGSSLWAFGAGFGYASPTNSWNWNWPRVSTGQVAGQIFYGTGKESLPSWATSTTIANFNVSPGVSGTTPGLPGTPYCDARVQTIDLDGYRGAANYIFEVKAGVPTLTIQNVKTAAGVSLDGEFNMLTTDLRRMPAGSGQPFLTCNWQTDPGNVNAHCFRNVTATSGWNITGLVNFPVGVVWFDSAFTVNGTSGNRDLYNALLSKGGLTLTQSGHGKLYAPNFAGASTLCGGPFWPTNLCDKSSGAPKLAEWTDADGNVHSGLPIGNTAILTEGQALLAGWEIFGSVMLGRQLGTAANQAVIHGSLIVGANQAGSSTTISQGGAAVIVPGSTSNQYLPVCTVEPGTTTTVTGYGASVRWSRYL